MKTINHPLWHYEPLRLTPAQTQNPNLALNDFFQSFPLNEVRETLWLWVTEAVSSPHSYANDYHERNNYMFFYEKIEHLIEAAWIMNQGSRGGSKPDRLVVRKIKDPVVKDTQPTHFTKPTRLIEKAQSHPEQVISEVFDQIFLTDLTEDLLPNWLQIAVTNTQNPYSSENGRKILHEFYEQLLLLIEELHVISESTSKIGLSYLSEAQLENPIRVLNQFFQQFSIDYVRRELCDFLDAGISFNATYANDFTPWLAWMSYNHLQCLTEAAYQLYLNQQMQSVTVRLYIPRNQ